MIRTAVRGVSYVSGVFNGFLEGEAEAEAVGAAPKIRRAELRQRHLSVSHKPTQISNVHTHPNGFCSSA